MSDGRSRLWRLVVQQGDVRGEVWVAEALPAEGRAAVPQLSLEDRPRVAVLPAGSELAEAWPALGGPAAIGWDDGASAALTEALGGWAG